MQKVTLFNIICEKFDFFDFYLQLFSDQVKKSDQVT